MRIRYAVASLLIVAAFAVALTLAGCGGGGGYGSAPTGGSTGTGASGSASGAAQKEVAVQMSSFAFVPANVDVAVGGTVTWTNNDSVAHTVSIDGKVSDKIDPGKTFSKTFAAAGTFPYSCTIHPSMTGVVTVK